MRRMLQHKQRTMLCCRVQIGANSCRGCAGSCSTVLQIASSSSADQVRGAAISTQSSAAYNPVLCVSLHAVKEEIYSSGSLVTLNGYGVVFVSFGAP
jgi:hypothetical protein